MWEHALAILGLGLLCGGWVALQRCGARQDPEARRRDGGCATCSCHRGECNNRGGSGSRMA